MIFRVAQASYRFAAAAAVAAWLAPGNKKGAGLTGPFSTLTIT